MNDAPAHVIGQSLMLSFEGPYATPEILRALEQTRACGVILFGNNIGSPAELHELNRTLQAHAAASGMPPLLIAIDQEGGNVTRLPAPFTSVPSQMAQAATGDVATTYQCACITGQQLHVFGINTNFAPVLDVNNNPRNPVIGTRSFGPDPATVARFGLEALRGYRDTGVIATIKHVPGHGDTDVDSHIGLPVVKHGRARLDRIEFMPFKTAIAAGAPALMTAHIVFPALDTLPATLSRPILTDLLRREWGFDGVVFTDALMMRAIADRYGIAEAALMSKAAGADVVLPLGSLRQQVEVSQRMCAAVDEGRIPLAAFEATAQRLAQLRAEYAITYDLPPFATPDSTFQTQALAVAQRGITLVQDRAMLPLPATTRLALVDCILPRFSQVEEALERAELLQTLVRGAFPHTTALVVGPEPSAADVAQAVELARGSEATLLVTRNASLIELQAQFAAALVASNTPVIHAAVRNPYDADLIPDAATTLLTYGDPPVSLQALVDTVAGRARPQGKLPVELQPGEWEL
jgi:beta-N-acetylhexosaminidase